MGHRTNPVGSRLLLTRQWESFLPSKFIFINDFFFKYFLIEVSLNFFLNLRINKRITKKIAQKYLKTTTAFVTSKDFETKDFSDFNFNNLYNQINSVNNLLKNQIILYKSKNFRSLQNINFFYKKLFLMFLFFNLKNKKVNSLNNYNSIIKSLFLFKKGQGRIVKQKIKNLFFSFHNLLLTLQTQKLQFNYCFFERSMGNINLRYFFNIEYLEAEYYNYVRFSQKRVRLKLHNLLFFKQESFVNSFKNIKLEKGIKNSEKKYKTKFKNFYKIFYLYDIEYPRSSLFHIPNNTTNKTLYLFKFYLNLSKNFANTFLKKISFIFLFFNKLLINDLKKLSYLKNIKVDFILLPFSYSNSIFFSKYLKYRLGNYESLGRVVYSFFGFMSRMLNNIAKLKQNFLYYNYLLDNKNEKFYLMDNMPDFNGLIEILGIQIRGSGRFTKKSRAMSKTFALGFIPLNKFHKNIDYILTEVRLKYGISGVKVWVYRSNNLKNN